MTVADPHYWDRQLHSQGQVRIGITVFKGLGLGCIGMFFMGIAGLCLFAGLVGSPEGAAVFALTLIAVASLILALFALVQITGRWDLYVSWDEVGYRHARVPWTEVVSVGDYESPHDRSDRPLTAIVFTPEGHERFLGQLTAPERWFKRLSSKSAGMPVLVLGKFLAGAPGDRADWLATVHAQTIEPPGFGPQSPSPPPGFH